MISDDMGKQLHQKFTRGEALSTEEHTQLEEWYASQDDAERHALGLASINEEELTALQAQVDAALAQLTTATTRIQEIASENETLRQEITVLRRRLIQQNSTLQAVA